MSRAGEVVNGPPGVRGGSPRSHVTDYSVFDRETRSPVRKGVYTSSKSDLKITLTLLIPEGRGGTGLIKYFLLP